MTPLEFLILMAMISLFWFIGFVCGREYEKGKYKDEY